MGAVGPFLVAGLTVPLVMCLAAVIASSPEDPVRPGSPVLNPRAAGQPGGAADPASQDGRQLVTPNGTDPPWVPSGPPWAPAPKATRPAVTKAQLMIVLDSKAHRVRITWRDALQEVGHLEVRPLVRSGRPGPAYERNQEPLACWRRGCRGIPTTTTPGRAGPTEHRGLPRPILVRPRAGSRDPDAIESSARVPQAEARSPAGHPPSARDTTTGPLLRQFAGW
jgi:hypothetical protein